MMENTVKTVQAAQKTRTAQTIAAASPVAMTDAVAIAITRRYAASQAIQIHVNTLIIIL